MPTVPPTPMPAPSSMPAPTSPPPLVVTPQPMLDELFGRFWPDSGVPARPALLFGSLATGLLAAVALPFHDLGLGLFLVLLAAGGVVFAANRERRDPFTLACGALCVLLAAITVVRDAEWIVVLCLLTGAALCIAGVSRGRTLVGFILAGISWPLAGLRGLPWLGRTIDALTGLGHSAAWLRTAVWSVLGLLVFGGLFASADALLAEWVDAVLPELTLDTFILRAFITVAVGGAVLAAAYLALNPAHVDRPATEARPVANRFEWLAPVLVVNGVFAAFLIAQAAVVFGGHGYLQRTTGLTYADYVHQGFGQLTVATALTLLVIWAAARKAPSSTAEDRLWLRGSLGLLCVQTLVVVGSALHRMDLYQEAYGFTRLRLLVDVFEGWLGVLVLASLVGGVWLRAAWVARFALLSGSVALLGLAMVNPDAWIASHNLDRYAETGRVDLSYLRGLSDDAAPTLAERGDLGRCALLDHEAADDDWLAWNLGRARAQDALDSLTGVVMSESVCPTSPWRDSSVVGPGH